MNRFVSLLLAVLMLFAAIPTAFASDSPADPLAGYNIVRYEDMAQLDSAEHAENVLVLTEEQFLAEGTDVKDLFEDAAMLYVLTDMSISEMQRIGELPALASSDEASSSKIATAITEDGQGYYAFHEVSALFQSAGTTRALAAENALTEAQKINDGLSAVLKTAETTIQPNQPETRMRPSGFFTSQQESTSIYDTSGNRIGSMGYTIYWYKIVKSGTQRIFDAVTVATFAPLSGYKCKKMTVYLGTSASNHSVLEATNLVTCGQNYTYSLSLSSTKGSSLTGNYTTSWSFDSNAQTVTKSFDMTTNDRKWTFEPVSPASGDAWIEEPGIRMLSTQQRCYTKVELTCPFITALGSQFETSVLSKNWCFDY